MDYCQGYIASGMVPAVWVNIVGHLMSHCFTRSILAPVIRTVCSWGAALFCLYRLARSMYFQMIVKLIIAYPYHVLHTVLMYKFSEVAAGLHFISAAFPCIVSISESLTRCEYAVGGG